MNQNISRKKFFKDIFKYSAGAAVGVAAGGILLPKDVPVFPVIVVAKATALLNAQNEGAFKAE